MNPCFLFVTYLLYLNIAKITYTSLVKNNFGIWRIHHAIHAYLIFSASLSHFFGHDLH